MLILLQFSANSDKMRVNSGSSRPMTQIIDILVAAPLRSLSFCYGAHYKYGSGIYSHSTMRALGLAWVCLPVHAPDLRWGWGNRGSVQSSQVKNWDFAMCTQALSCWNRKRPSPDHRSGSTLLDMMLLCVVALRFLIIQTKGPRPKYVNSMSKMQIQFPLFPDSLLKSGILWHLCWLDLLTCGNYMEMFQWSQLQCHVESYL